MSAKMRMDRRLSMSDASPSGIHPRRHLPRSNTGLNPPQTPPACLRKTRSSMMNQRKDDDPNHGSISCELQALEKMMHHEGFGLSDSIDFENGVPLVSVTSPLFVRGRFYDEYSARRNERLKSKKGMVIDEKKSRYDLGVRTELVKRRDFKKMEVVKKKTIPTPPLKEMRENVKPKTVYSLRSSIPKENKRLSLPLSLTASVGVERKMAAARGARKF